MARTGNAEITITDINDGTDPITAFMSNPNHTFAASSAGVVSNISNFSSTLNVFVGSIAATQDASLASARTFRIVSAVYKAGTTSTGWQTPSLASDTITIASIAATAIDSVVITVSYEVRNATSTIPISGSVEVSLSVVREGTGGAVIEMIANKNIFTADSAGTTDTPQDGVEITIFSQGQTGNYEYFISENGGNFVQTTNTDLDGEGRIARFDTDTSGNINMAGNLPTSGTVRVLFNTDNIGTNDSMTLRVNGSNGGTDTVSVFKVRQGVSGDAALLISVTSSDGTTFKNTAGDAKTLTANVTDASTGVAPSGTISYSWTRANGADVRVTSSSDRTVVPSGGVVASGTAFSTIVVGPEDVTNQERFGVSVTVT